MSSAWNNENNQLVAVEDDFERLPVIYEESNPSKEDKQKKKLKKKEYDHFLPNINNKSKSNVKHETWVRIIDTNLNVYYYNSITGESVWLPPCTTCNEPSFKWCIECNKSYCDSHYNKFHKVGKAGDLKHTFSATEPLVKAEIQPEEQYCVKCTTNAAVYICTECWDPYCDVCFRSVHNVGYLKQHQAIDYEAIKTNWICVRSEFREQPDYYVHGSTGKTTFEKPEELMTELEGLYFRNFKICQQAAEKYVAKLETLQLEVESVKYERDNMISGANDIMADIAAGMDGGGHRSKSKRSGGKGGKKLDEVNDSNTVLENAKIYNLNMKGDLMDGFISVEKATYRDLLLNPSDRRRGQNRTDFIKSLLDK